MGSDMGEVKRKRGQGFVIARRRRTQSLQGPFTLAAIRPELRQNRKLQTANKSTQKSRAPSSAAEAAPTSGSQALLPGFNPLRISKDLVDKGITHKTLSKRS